MSTELRRDIQAKSDKSAFILTEEATFNFNPNYTSLNQKREEKEEQKRESELQKS